MPEAKGWLARQEFPPAPLFAWSLPPHPDQGAERFAERLHEIRADGWKNIRAGITRSAADAEGLEGMKIKTIVMADEDDEIELPKTAARVADWKAVLKNLK